MKLTRREFMKLSLAAGASLVLPNVAMATVPPSILWIGWDGADYRTIASMLRVGRLPNLSNLNVVRLDCAGCTVTKPGWVEIVNGVEYPQSGVRSNSVYTKVPLNEILFRRIYLAKENNYWCGCIFSKVHHTGDEYILDDDVWKYEPWYNIGPDGLWQPNYYQNARGNPYSIEQTNGYLWTAIDAHRNSLLPGLIFCHYCKPDETGHDYGMDSAAYLYDLTMLDAALGEAIDRMRPDHVIVCSDHGFDDSGATEHNNAPDGFVASDMPLENNCVRRDIGYTVSKMLGPLPVPANDDPADKPLHGKDMRRL